jgi:FKBP-type peptidyl-prolyl cis-trans isomerase
MKSWFVPAFGLGLFVSSLCAQEQSALTNRTQRFSYALGMDVVRVLKVDDFDIDLKLIAAGMADMQAGKPALNAQEQKAALKEMQDDILARAVAKKEAAGAIHRKEGEAFLAANVKKPGIKIKQVTAPDGSQAELQYRILKSGNGGPSPKKTDVVEVRYHGTFTDGREFDVIDKAAKHGDVATLNMNDVIPAWAAALQLMKVGDQWQLFVPPSLGYADYGPPEIGMHTTLIYELELVGFSAPNDANAAPAPSK